MRDAPFDLSEREISLVRESKGATDTHQGEGVLRMPMQNTETVHSHKKETTQPRSHPPPLFPPQKQNQICNNKKQQQ